MYGGLLLFITTAKLLTHDSLSSSLLSARRDALLDVIHASGRTYPRPFRGGPMRQRWRSKFGSFALSASLPRILLSLLHCPEETGRCMRSPRWRRDKF